jgi:hypothetical protein
MPNLYVAHEPSHAFYLDPVQQASQVVPSPRMTAQPL